MEPRQSHDELATAHEESIQPSAGEARRSPSTPMPTAAASLRFRVCEAAPLRTERHILNRRVAGEALAESRPASIASAGRQANAWAMTTLCRSPALNRCGYASYMLEPASTWNDTSETTGTVMFRTEIESNVRSRTANAPGGIPPIPAQGGAGRNGDKQTQRYWNSGGFWSRMLGGGMPCRESLSRSYPCFF